jgi:multiple sugar transport system permease protein
MSRRRSVGARGGTLAGAARPAPWRRRACPRLGAWLLLAPYLFGALLFFGVPALLSFGLAFTRYDALGPPEWIGLENFRYLWRENRVWVAAGNSLYFILLAVPLRVLGALLLTLLLQRARWGVGLYRVIVYLPTVIPDAAYALIWLWIFNPIYGPLNPLLGALGLPAPYWLTDPNTAKLVFVVLSLFQIGEGFVVLLAALKEMPHEYYEAAEVLGGSRWQAFCSVTLPMLAPWLMILTVRDVIMSFHYTFTLSYLMTGGDPYYATLFLSLLTYEEAFDRFRFGHGSALMLLTFAMTSLMIALLYRLYRRFGRVDEH